MLKIDDFCYARRGQVIDVLFEEHLNRLAPLNIKNNHHNKALLLLHGFSSSPAVFRKLLPLLTAYDAIICPVLPGHAESISAFSKIQAQEWVLNVESISENLLHEYRQVDVMGLSLGGLLACHLSQIFKFNHAYLLAPAIALKQNISFNYYLAKFLQSLKFESVRNFAGDLYNQTESELTYRKLPLSTIIEILGLILKFKLSQPLCPTDIFLGYFDHVVDSDKVAQRFEGIPNSQIHWLKNSAHILPLEDDMEHIATCIHKNHQ